MNSRAEDAMRKREDISRFMVHLTRDDETEWPEGVGGTARKNFEEILDDGAIFPIKPHCLHGRLIRQWPQKVQDRFRVACFTETPLHQIKHLLNLPWRQVKLEPYGFVFERDFLYQKDAQPATYINEYYGNKAQRNAFDRIFSIASKNSFSGLSWRVLPFVNVMHDGHDFAWEREWRVAGEVRFDLDDLVCVILPEYEGDLRGRMATKGIAAIDPDWGQERVVAELASQQRRTKQIWKDKLPKHGLKPKLKLAQAGA